MKKILIINPFGIGDVLFTTPVISSIKDNWPDSFIGYWCNERVSGIFKGDPNLSKVFALSRGDFKNIYKNHKLEGIKRFLGLLSAIRKERFDIALDFSLDHRYSLIAKMLGIRRRFGFNYKNRGRFLTKKIDLEGYEDKHIVEYYLELLKFIDINPTRLNLYLNISESSKLEAKALLKEAGISQDDLIAAIAPGAGASWGKDACLKHWPIDKYAQLTDKIIDNLGAKVLILGDASEQHIGKKILRSIRNNALDLSGKLGIESLTAVMSNAHILITNDGGPLHIASSLGKKTVSFFGPVDPKVYGPYPPDSNRHIVLKKGLDCSPCYRKFRLIPCVRNKECLESISVEEALGAVRKLLPTS